ncbi:hypothetical protein RUM43_010400 [Polyplax serrata]|uniref:Serpin domain-containing protein n=1 Tax=Polyplax serrata TaxID=468196 RepID=A0AAN8PKT4_POLSC
MYFLLAVLLVTATTSSIITFPTSFTSFEDEKINPSDVKNRYQKGIEAAQSVAGLVQNILLQETVDFAAQNWVISPVSLAGVFAQLLMGSRGEIREILTDALSLEYDEKNLTKLEVHRQLGDLLKYLHHPSKNDYTLLLNSAVFLQTEFPLKATYKHALMDFYDTPILPVDFAGNSSKSINKINQWVRNSTLNRFSDLMTLPLSPNTVSIMASIVYFKGAWELPFDPDYTQPGLFFIDDKRKVQVDFMYGEQQVFYGNSSDFQLIGIPYKSHQIVIYILLPNKKFSSRVAMNQFDQLATSAKLENVTLVLPKIKLSTTISVKDAISKYLRRSRQNYSRQSKFGRNVKYSNEVDSFSNSNLPIPIIASSMSTFRKAKRNDFDLGGASDDVRFKIDDIIHKVSMQIDEFGTELVAATSTLVDHSGDDFVLRINRPFLFFVRHEITLTHLFCGFVTNPTQSSTVQKPTRKF